MLAARVAHPLVSSSLRRASGGFVGTSAATLVEESPSLIQGLLLQIARGPGPGGRGLRERVMSAAAGSGQAPSPPSSTTWEGAASQEEFMAKDTCILLDDADKVIGSASKKECHTFRADQPQGLLHRAFSVFLFNERNELLLQKRASSKITFPDVWTNTCCSHPLHGYAPSEVDGPEDVRSGRTLGVKRAAIRKLGHELGIPPEQVPISQFNFLTRLHYCAADVVTWGPQSPWGEHEIDYILFIRPTMIGKQEGGQAASSPPSPPSPPSLSISPNPEEVGEYRWVNQKQLKAMLANQDLLWSPWFRIIEREFLHTWWDRMDESLHTRAFQDGKIWKLDLK